jgi:PBSX family phage portal protein
MSKEKATVPVKVKIVKSSITLNDDEIIEKSLIPTQINSDEAASASDWITPKYDMKGLRNMVSQSTILPQCTRAYRNNIPGYGIGIRYKDDVDETPEMAAEFTRATEIIELLNFDMDTKEVFEDIIEAREIYGIAYLEVIRNVGGEVSQIEFIKDIPSVTKTKPLEPYQDVQFWYQGRIETRSKKFMKYRQQISGKTVYFKEFGDKRIMDSRTGQYVDELDMEYQANEILEFAIGTEPYGEVRWMGQVLSVDGMRKAEFLNNNYFKNGRHTPLMIMIQGGTLTDESFDKLQQYMDGIKGEDGQHSFIILETENTDNTLDFEGNSKPNIEIKDLAGILQKDELFQDYLDNGRKKVQSAFLLPDLYVGYTTDFNRATSQTAMEVTEKQVFQPERLSLAWVINNKLLSEYGFKYVEAYFLEPDISNPDDLVKIIQACSAAGGLTPNKAKQIIYEALGEVSEDYEGDWGEIPLAYSKGSTGTDTLSNLLGVSTAIQKAHNNHDDDVVPVLQAIKKYLQRLEHDKKE